MKKAVLGILLGLAVLCQPITAHAHERQCPTIIEVTQAEAVELMQIASAEALSQGTAGMLLVMSVIMNRVESPDYPDTIHEVIHQAHQFYTAGMESAELTPDVHMALAQLEMGCKYPEIVAFERSENNSLDIYYDEAFTFLDHSFYTVKH